MGFFFSKNGTKQTCYKPFWEMYTVFAEELSHRE